MIKHFGCRWEEDAGAQLIFTCLQFILMQQADEDFGQSVSKFTSYDFTLCKVYKHVSTFTKLNRFHCSQYVYHTAIQLLAIGYNVSKRVEVSKVFHWQVDQRQQPVNGVLVDAQTHFGMNLCHHEPVRARASDVSV